MNINELLEIYKNKCPYYDNTRFEEAKRGDYISIINVGTDFARSKMFEKAVVCWQYVADLGKGNADVFSNLGVCYYYGNGVPQDYKKFVINEFNNKLWLDINLTYLQ
jgi:TPR repeat protein